MEKQFFQSDALLSPDVGAASREMHRWTTTAEQSVVTAWREKGPVRLQSPLRAAILTVLIVP
jgi:hypothetical protein